MKSMISIAVMLLALLLVACAQQTAPTAPPDLGLSLRVEPHPPAVGPALLIVTLSDGSGAPVDGATLQVHADMDHQGMMPIDREVSQSASGEYHVPFEWTMGGGWNVTVTARLPDNGGESSQTFTFFVEAVSSQSIINRHSVIDIQVAPETTAPAGSDHSQIAVTDQNVPVTITYQPDHDPAFAGDAAVTISLHDQSGQPITDAAVEITADMAHQGMMPASGTGRHTASGNYLVPLRWTMAGDWLVTVKVIFADGSIVETTFPQPVVMRDD